MGLLKTLKHTVSSISIRASEEKPPEHSQALCAHSTITTMLSILNRRAKSSHTNMQSVDHTKHQELRRLSALSTLMVRKDEVVAVVVKSYHGDRKLELVASAHQTIDEEQHSAPAPA
jgi:hypothetical protein